MLKKIIKIKGVGRFTDYAVHGDDTQLLKTNIIYAENSKGKSTLTAILRSLGLKDDIAISKRKTFGYAGDQEVEILGENNHKYEYKQNAWNKNKNNIEVFDSFFVHDNLFSGFEFSVLHRKNLHKFILGKEGVTISNQINGIKSEIEELNRDIRSIEKQLKIYSAPYQIEDFIQLKKDDKIREKIEKITKQIKTAELHNEIVKKNPMSKVDEVLDNIKWDDLKDVLSKTLSSIESSAVSKVEEHKRKLKEVIKDNAEGWISQGYEVSREKKLNNRCPFCLQDLKGSDIFRSYQQYFNKEYDELQNTMQSTVKEFSEINIDSELKSIELVMSTNETLEEFWKNYITATFTFTHGLDAGTKSKIPALFKTVQKLLNDKMKNILQEVKTLQVDNMSKEISILNAAIKSYNTIIDKFNSSIDEIKKEPLKSLAELKEELNQLEAQKKRFDKNANDLCEQYLKKNISLNKSNALKEQRQEELNKYSDKIFKDYGNKINGYLNKFNVNFEIAKVEGGYKGTSKDPSAEYVIKMAGEYIKFDDDSIHSFRHTLSEGDKSSLAFAFFLARLELDKTLSEKVLVLDDPLSSLDTARRKRTIEYIEEFSKKVTQIIVLSHHDNFVYWLYKTEPFKKAKTLCIEDKGIICIWDIEKEMQHEYFAAFAKIEEYIKNSSTLEKDAAKRQIRVCLENDLKFRFHSYLKRPCKKSDGGILPPITGSTGLNSIIQKLEHSDCHFRCKDKKKVIEELNRLNEFSREDFHSKGDIAHISDRAQDSEIQGYLKSVVDLIEKKL